MSDGPIDPLSSKGDRKSSWEMWQNYLDQAQTQQGNQEHTSFTTRSDITSVDRALENRSLDGVRVNQVVKLEQLEAKLKSQLELFAKSRLPEHAIQVVHTVSQINNIYKDQLFSGINPESARIAREGNYQRMHEVLDEVEKGSGLANVPAKGGVAVERPKEALNADQVDKRAREIGSMLLRQIEDQSG